MTTERDIHNQLVYARDKGLEEGLKKGREEGEAKGLKRGRTETVSLIAEQLKKTGMSEEEVQRILDAARS